MRTSSRVALKGEVRRRTDGLAERRLGEMMAAQRRTIGLSKGAVEPGTNRGTTRVAEKPASLAEAGINKNLADRARKAARVSAEEFEQFIAEEREAISAIVEKTTASIAKASQKRSRKG